LFLLLLLLQRLEREIADFSKDHDKRVKAATTKLKAAKQVGAAQPRLSHGCRSYCCCITIALHCCCQPVVS
jgi:hypothetical protein